MPISTFFRNHVAIGAQTAAAAGTYPGTNFRPPPGTEHGIIILEITAITGSPSLDLFFDTSPDIGTNWVPENGGTKINGTSYTAVGNYGVIVGPATSGNGVVLGDYNHIHTVISGTGTITYKLIFLTEDRQ